MSKKIRVRQPDGSVVAGVDEGDANLSAEDEAYWEQAGADILESAGRPLPEHLKTVGRPSLHGGKGESPAVSFRLDGKRRTAAEQLAARRGISLSQLARQALDRELNQSA